MLTTHHDNSFIFISKYLFKYFNEKPYKISNQNLQSQVGRERGMSNVKIAHKCQNRPHLSNSAHKSETNLAPKSQNTFNIHKCANHKRRNSRKPTNGKTIHMSMECSASIEIKELITVETFGWRQLVCRTFPCPCLSPFIQRPCVV